MSEGGLQSVERAFEVLELLTGSGRELSLSEITAATGRPAPSVHRLVRTLVALGYVRQEASRRYALAPALIRLGDAAARQFGTWANPLLAELVDQIGESANMAILDGAHALYVAHVAGRHTMRMFTEVGHRVPLHSTGVGKALLTQLPEAEAGRLLRFAGMPRITDQTITDPSDLLQELSGARALGYTLDNGEQEVGVACVAVPVPAAPSLTAISFSAPAPRLTPEVVRKAAAALREGATRLAERFAAERAGGPDL
ncbi:IclR family transcriptional regulator [Actinoplanes sp. URMC 104]|uniref:IclR family transcriptional regulator n=1 Tax=Actinoplanes sp. URMC 104 TaxID=3423409 RepID=UPI003F1C4675